MGATGEVENLSPPLLPECILCMRKTGRKESILYSIYIHLLEESDVQRFYMGDTMFKRWGVSMVPSLSRPPEL